MEERNSTGTEQEPALPGATGSRSRAEYAIRNKEDGSFLCIGAGGVEKKGWLTTWPDPELVLDAGQEVVEIRSVSP